MVKFKKVMETHYYYFCLALFDLLDSIYGLFHLNYLDNPKITPFHVHDPLSFIGKITDDLWFNLILLMIGIILLYSISNNNQKLADYVFYISVFFEVLVCFSFSIRGLWEQHYNITWAISLILILMTIHSPREDGGK